MEHMGRLWLFRLLARLTENPILALLVVIVLSAGSYGYLTGRIFKVGSIMKEWQVIGTLRQQLTTNPNEPTARSELGRDATRNSGFGYCLRPGKIEPG